MDEKEDTLCVLPCYLCEQQNGIKNCIERYIPVVPSKPRRVGREGTNAPGRRTRACGSGRRIIQTLISAWNALKETASTVTDLGQRS